MKYQYWLSNVLLSNAKKERLVQEMGSARDCFFMTEQVLDKIEWLSEEEKERLLESRKTWKVEEAFYRMGEQGICFTSIEEPNYPQRLREIHDKPYALFFRGRLPAENRLTVAFVGARRCSEYGKGVSKHFAALFAAAGVQVVSGMALGVDSCAHLGALEEEKDTYAVLGCGVDICYPKSASTIYEKIPNHGGILSEYPPGTQPVARNFPIRNRIISGLSDLVIVVEAKKKSGSLITADFALEQGKEVYAVPGRITDPLSSGTNRLISQGAGILLSFEDLLSSLKLDIPIFHGKVGKIENALEKEELMVYASLDLLPKSLEELQSKTGLSLSKLREILWKLSEMELIHENFPNFFGRRY